MRIMQFLQPRIEVKAALRSVTAIYDLRFLAAEELNFNIREGF